MKREQEVEAVRTHLHRTISSKYQMQTLWGYCNCVLPTTIIAKFSQPAIPHPAFPIPGFVSKARWQPKAKHRLDKWDTRKSYHAKWVALLTGSQDVLLCL